MTYTHWTREMDRALAARYMAGGNVAEIAATMGLSVGSIRTRISTLGLLRRSTKKNGNGQGNADWLLGPALASIMHVPATDDFCDDLVAQLDGITH